MNKDATKLFLDALLFVAFFKFRVIVAKRSIISFSWQLEWNLVSTILYIMEMSEPPSNVSAWVIQVNCLLVLAVHHFC
jgi:hypothetical protein